jgi:precorrin-8X/cobalt-precorrin-8 methylmutase
MYDYLRDPTAIYEKSFATIAAEADFSGMDEATQTVATRIIHACGMPEILPDLDISEGFTDKAAQALASGAPILSDCEMVTHGIIRRFLTSGNNVICTLNSKAVPDMARDLGTTRSAAAIELWQEHLDGAVAVFGNAPTALFHLLELLAKTEARPAAIVGLPVGFVGAAESKAALAKNSFGVSYLTLHGRRGGSAMAAATVNGLASLAKERK